MFFSWNDEYSVAIDEIDQEHYTLVDLINEIYMAMHENKSSEAIPVLFKHLNEYTKDHFSTEEALMEKVCYPNINEHVSEHEKMINKLTELEARHLRGRAGVSVELLLFLRDWLDNHIRGADKTLAQFIQGACR